MENENNNSNIAFIKNLNKQAFTTTVNLQVDSKANIKTILNSSCHVFDIKINSANGKAIITGKVGVKVLYVDNDNLTNIITDTQPFSENVLDNAITSDCFLTLTNTTSTCQCENNGTSCKVDCLISFNPVLYVNLAWNDSNLDNSYITKQSQLSTTQISENINTNFEYTTNLETKDEISKILFVDTYLTQTNATAQNGYATVEGKIFTNVVYETNEQEENKVKLISDVFNFKNDVELQNLTESDVLNLTLSLDKSKQTISTELEDDNSIISINNFVNVNGAVLKHIELNIVEDLYSTTNELNLNKSQREFLCNCNNIYVNENVFGEVNLNKDEPAIEEIIANCNISYEITNTYIKNGTIYFEGVINSNLIYIDETKQIINKMLEIPFVVNTKHETETLPNHFTNLSITTNSLKARRGTIIELDYSVCACICLFDTCTMEIVDNVNIRKEIDFSKYDYQIFIAKPNETMWELCKRIKCHPNTLNECNKNLPSSFVGGEKIIVKR